MANLEKKKGSKWCFPSTKSQETASSSLCNVPIFDHKNKNTRELKINHRKKRLFLTKAQEATFARFFLSMKN